jgi:hypothetical protein
LIYHAYSAKAAAIRMFLRLFQLGVLAFEVCERHVQRLVAEADQQASIPEHLGPTSGLLKLTGSNPPWMKERRLAA